MELGGNFLSLVMVRYFTVLGMTGILTGFGRVWGFTGLSMARVLTGLVSVRFFTGLSMTRVLTGLVRVRYFWTGYEWGVDWVG